MFLDDDAVGGAKRDRAATGMRRELLAMLDEPSDDGRTSHRRAILGVLLRMAEEGDLAAIREIFDRSDGKSQVMPATDDRDRKVTFQWLDTSSDTLRDPSSPASTLAASGLPAS